MAYFYLLVLFFCFGLINLLNYVFTAISSSFEEGEVKSLSSKESTAVYRTYQLLKVAQ